ncbi:MAG: response regulator transcription factor [Pseudomonadota bacterium]
MRVLFVEDEPALIRSAVPFLRSEGFTVDVVSTLAEANSASETFPYDAILLDRQLPDGDGLSFLDKIRINREHVPVIIMSAAFHTANERVNGLNSGADDYLAKPLALEELLARLRSVLRRPSDMENQVVELGNLRFDLSNRQLSVGGKTVQVARREADVMERLVRAPNRIVTRAQLEDSVYGFDDEVSFNAIDVSMHRLRSILKQSGASAIVKTVRGIGFILTTGEQHD